MEHLKSQKHELETPEFYKIIPEFNTVGRLCNYGSGNNPTVQVPANEWERFNRLAGRQHEIIDGIVVFNPDLKPCIPDIEEAAEQQQLTIRQLTSQITDLQLALCEIYEGGVSYGENLR